MFWPAFSFAYLRGSPMFPCDLAASFAASSTFSFPSISICSSIHIIVIVIVVLVTFEGFYILCFAKLWTLWFKTRP
jgi:hypothetical protein